MVLTAIRQAGRMRRALVSAQLILKRRRPPNKLSTGIPCSTKNAVSTIETHAMKLINADSLGPKKLGDQNQPHAQASNLPIYPMPVIVGLQASMYSGWPPASAALPTKKSCHMAFLLAATQLPGTSLRTRSEDLVMTPTSSLKIWEQMAEVFITLWRTALQLA